MTRHLEAVRRADADVERDSYFPDTLPMGTARAHDCISTRRTSAVDRFPSASCARRASAGREVAHAARQPWRGLGGDEFCGVTCGLTDGRFRHSQFAESVSTRRAAQRDDIRVIFGIRARMRERAPRRADAARVMRRTARSRCAKNRGDLRGEVRKTNSWTGGTVRRVYTKARSRRLKKLFITAGRT